MPWSERLGVWGPLALIAGMLVQAALPLLPAAADVVLAALLYGFWGGFAIVYTGTLLGAALGYRVGQRFGGWAVRRLAGERMTRRLEAFAGQRGVRAVLLVRLMPALKAEVMNLVAGAVGMAFLAVYGRLGSGGASGHRAGGVALGHQSGAAAVGRDGPVAGGGAGRSWAAAGGGAGGSLDQRPHRRPSPPGGPPA